MGYRSQVALKTTTEGYILMKKFNDSIKDIAAKPLHGMCVERTPEGFYKISHDDIKWYESYPDVDNFMTMLQTYNEQDVPYKFIRIGEDPDDVELLENWTDDMPDEIMTFDLSISMYDEDEGNYEEVKEDED